MTVTTGTPNYEAVIRGSRIVHEALAPFVYRELTSRFGAKWYTEGVLNVVSEGQRRDLPTSGETPAVQGAMDFGLKPWREVIEPHPDVASGRYHQAEFAADLAQVLAGKAELEYGDPGEFFSRTYLTEGMQAMLVAALERVA